MEPIDDYLTVLFCVIQLVYFVVSFRLTMQLQKALELYETDTLVFWFNSLKNSSSTLSYLAVSDPIKKSYYLKLRIATYSTIALQMAITWFIVKY